MRPLRVGGWSPKVWGERKDVPQSQDWGAADFPAGGAESL